MKKNENVAWFKQKFCLLMLLLVTVGNINYDRL